MKIFAVYFRIVLTKKPDWFSEFREKFKTNSILHVTLIQPRYSSEDDIPRIQRIVGEVLNRNVFTDEDKKLYFDTLASGPESDGRYVFMLCARENPALVHFQKDLLVSLQDFQQYCDDATRDYETRFRVHITIGANIDSSRKDEAERYFMSDYGCEGEVTNLVLPFVKNISIEETENPQNLTVFALDTKT